MTKCPGPARRPFADYADELRLDPMNFSAQVAAKFGGMTEVPVGRRDSLFLVADPELIREMLIEKRASFVKNTRYDAMRRLLGNGMLLSEHEDWRRQRRLLQPAFKPAALARHFDWVRDLIVAFVDRWDVHADRGTPIDMLVEFQRLAQAVAARLTFGPTFAGHEDELFRTLLAVWRSWPARRSFSTWLHWRKTRERARQLDAAMDALDAFIFAAIERCRAVPLEEGGLVGQLIHASAAEGAPCSPVDLRDQAITMIGAGYETSASAMCWTHILLDRHPGERDRVFAEVDAWTALGGARDTASLERLAYTEQFIQESMRLYLPIHSFARVATTDTEVGGHCIAKGKTAVVAVHAMHHQERYWPDPERFDPGRFTPEQCAARSRYAYLPFGVGHRACIGSGFAMTEAVLTVALIAQRFRLEAVPGQVFEPAPGTTVYPRRGLKMTVHRRQAATASAA